MNPPRRHRTSAACLLCLLSAPVAAQSAATDDTATLDTVRVTAPRLRMEDIYGAKPPVRTPPTRFNHAWREPVNLKKIGDNGGIVPIVVAHAAREITRELRTLPGWKPPVQAATARPSPLDSAQLSRAARQPPPEEPH